MLKSVERSKIRDVVAGRLKDLIAEGNLQPGDRLPTETELATRFGVNRLSLREATKALEFLGIVEAKPGRGLMSRGKPVESGNRLSDRHNWGVTVGLCGAGDRPDQVLGEVRIGICRLLANSSERRMSSARPRVVGTPSSSSSSSARMLRAMADSRSSAQTISFAISES